MRSAIDMPAFFDFADLRLLTRAAVAAENAGWDRFAIWDHINWAIDAPVPTADAWLAAAVVAAATERIEVAMWVTPLPRKLPQEVARQAISLARFSGGRFVLGVGSGGGGPFDAAEFGSFGMATDARERGAQLDEALEVIVALWSGERAAHHGRHYTAADVAFAPSAPYRPGAASIPVWVGGFWGNPRPLRRASRYDGYAPVRRDGQQWSAADVGVARGQLEAARAESDEHPVQLTFGGSTAGPDDPLLAELAAAGLDWWSESIWPGDTSPADVLARIERGPAPTHRPPSGG